MKKNNMRIIAVAMGEPDSATRNDEVSGMLDYGFAQYNLKKVLSTNLPIKEVKLSKSKKDKVSLVPIEDVNIVYKKVDKEPNITYKVDIKKINAKINKGDVVGNVKLYNNNELIDTVELTVFEDVKKLNLVELFLKNLKEIILAI